MRTLIDIGEADLEALDRLAREENVSRASLIRAAVRDYLRRNAKEKQAEAFGLWGEGGIDGLKFQEEIRGEW
ncbi:CopG family transcriptional regulator [Rhizobium sp. LC145]|jgi:metal-responsive CopG/Arc/MetJ family transcriptional regulator|uniref:ribbon-helix-helix domain-containing protein n=1 Tax=Rhizobium sp. LC145 TaxID=1120688 RepID=UPI000629F91B|nr:CopG family transcriptional regulator [Rhizobium sp. LC145]KKX28191.1 CopG family transcriptional regulator [Rhizobium sp. LC145]TKT46221.1 CopG family transcriptional regulator [Rhizobiaceae bacterium LC148]